jgi:serine/threonine-protein kinase
MPLSPGTRLGVYEIIAPLGAGGMGQVYRARDTRLNRAVAIKAMHEATLYDPDRVARFQREAQLLASLNHPNIAAIHGLEDVGGATYIVLEYVDGQPLSNLIKDGPLAVDEALRLARKIAGAIAAAHERGIIHRDLKPGNVMVATDGQPKVLDFGLGKAIEGDGSRGDPSLPADSPTMTLAATQAGIILGTAGYMSPEQAKGRVADKRSDVWAFGCLLFEMLSGRRAFEGEDVTDTLAAIVRGEPDWTALPAATPPAVRALIERCLVKNRAERLPDMSVVRFVLDEPSTMAGSAAEVPATASAGSTLRRRTAFALVAAATVITAAAAVLWPRGASTTSAGLARLTIVVPDGDQINVAFGNPVAIAPDGSAVAYSAIRNGKVQIFVRELADSEPRALPGTDGGRLPFFKPDGRWLGFFAQGKLKKITAAGNALQALADASNPMGGTWSHDDTIYFAPSNIAGLSKVSASGGALSQVTTLDRGAGEVSHRWPSVLPDNRTLLFSVWTGPGPDEHHIERLDLAGSTRQIVVRNMEGPTSVVGGFLITGGRLDSPLAVPWRPESDLTDVEPIALPFESQPGGEGTSMHAVSADGTFAYVPAVRGTAKLVWIDRAGGVAPLPLPERRYVAALISPDGLRAAVQISGGTEEIWLFDLSSYTLTPFVTTGGSSQSPVWSADSRHIYYRGTRSGFRNIFRKAVDGSGAEERLTTKPDVSQTPFSVTSDGKWLLYGEGGPSTRGGNDLWKFALVGGVSDPAPFLATEDSESFARVSPDNRWVAYVSDAGGLSAVWVRPFEGGAARRLSGDTIALAPVWSRDGRDLYFVAADGLRSVSVSGDTFGAPRTIAPGRFVTSQNSNSNYDSAKDGRLLHMQPAQELKVPTRIEIILNGLALLRRPGEGR